MEGTVKMEDREEVGILKSKEVIMEENGSELEVKYEDNNVLEWGA